MPTTEMKEYLHLDASSLGFIWGEIVTAPNGKRIVKFLGVPYAQQPVGDLRFKPLTPLEPPLGTKETPFLALKVGSSSIQKDGLPGTTNFPTGEDCIYLNIFAPLEGIDRDDKSVFFHIHCGGFLMGSGSEATYDLTNFSARHNSVGVSINYRLGILGFLSIPSVIEENLGLKDQQMALKWVQEHIASFGGDRNKVTIYGCSAGAVSAHYHLVNKESIKLFDRAILSSGAIVPEFADPKQHKKKVKWVLKQLGCPKNVSEAEIFQFLMSLDACKFAEVGKPSFEDLIKCPSPIISFMENTDCFAPLERKAILVGTTSEEGSLYPPILFPERAISDSKMRQLMSSALSERLFLGPTRKLLDALTNQRAKDYPVFGYLFDYQTTTRGEKVLSPSEYPEGVGKAHSLDMAFFTNQLCQNSFYVPKATPTDILVNSSIADMVEKFMTQELGNIDLPIFSAESHKISRITAEGIMIDECDFTNSAKKFPETKMAISFCLLKMFPHLL